MQLGLRLKQLPDRTYVGWCPALPGCVVWAESRALVRQRLETAVEGYLGHIDEALPRELAHALHGPAKDRMPASA